MNKKLLLSFILFFTFLINYGQSASGYCFSTGTDTYSALASGTNVPGLSAGDDDELSSVVPITFPFIFGGTEYSQVVVSSNGWLSFGSPSVNAVTNYTNSVTNAGVIGPILFPLWDDLANTIRPRYVVTGAAPNRIFKLEWSQQKWNFGASGGVISFQVWLFESSNVIEYHYKQESISVATTGTTFGASIGIYDANGSYLTLNGSGTSPNASTTFTPNISNKPANNQVYRFTPPSLTSISQAQAGTEYTLCIDNANTVTGTVNSGQYAVVNVINGFNYTFSVQNVFSGIENLTLLDMSNKNVNPAAVVSGSSGASLTWTANFSGQVKVLLSGGCITNGTSGGPLTLAINIVSNKQDSQTAFGNDTWKGHIYNWTGTTPPGGFPSPATLAENRTPFITTSTANYAGYYDVGAKTFPANFNFGGDDDTGCFDVYSDGVVRTSILKHNFAVRYRMKSTQAPGCYMIKIKGDDGVRLYVDTKLVFDRWVQQAPTNYDYILVYLGATSNLVFDYYENASNNQVSYEIKPFDASANKIYDQATNATTLKFCNGGTPGIIGGSFQYNSEDDTMANPYIDFRWYVSTNGGATYALASGTNNLRTYTPPVLNANNTTADVVYLYKRTATSNGTVSGGTCNFQESNIVTIINSPRVVITTQPSAQSICEGKNGSFSVVSSNINATYQWQYSNSNATGATWTNTDLITGLSGHTTNQLTLANIPFSYNSNYLRCIVSNGACSATSNAVLLTVYPSATISGTLSICIGSTTSLTGSGTKSASNPWVSSSPAVATVSDTGLVTGKAAGTSVITYTNSNGCSITATVTVGSLPAIALGTITDVNCASLGSVVLNNLPLGNWKINQTGFATASIDSPTNSTTSYTVTGLASGSYYFSVSIGSCASPQTAIVNIGDQPTTSWDGNSWSNGDPDDTKKVFVTAAVPKQPFLSSNLFVAACSLTITSADAVIVPSGVTLTITNGVMTNGKLEFKNNSSLKQINNDPTINSGDISYERISTPIFQKDYIYWSSPVKNQKLGDLSPGTDPQKFFFNDGTNWVFIDRSNNMDIGKGYIIRGPLSYSNSTKQTFPAIFKGVPNNGSLEGELLSKGKYHLIGNPYPSALNADALISQNSTLLNGTIYFWTHNTPINSSLSQDYQYTTDDYATYNLSGGVSAKSDINHNNPVGVDNGIKPTGKIAAGQSFFVSTRTAGKVQFNNTMRVGGNNNQFFKSGNTEKEVVLEKNRIWLNMTNDKGAFKQLLVGYIEGATNFYENRYDGITFDGNTYLDFYSVNNGNKFVIQGRALPFDDSDIVPLGYRAAMEGDFTISIDEVDGKMKNQAIYIEDKVTGKIHDLRKSNYTFKTAIGTFTDRLILRYTDKTLGTGDFENIEDGILISVKNKTINVLSSKENIKDVTIFDITGKTLYTKNKVSNTELQIQNLPSSNQVLLVKVTLDNDFITTRKIIFQ